MRKLRLNYVHCFYYDLFNFTPNLSGIFPVYFSIPFTNELALQHVFEPQFVLLGIKFFVVFIQRIVSQMCKSIIKVLVWFVFLARQSHKAIIVQIDCHWTYHLGNQHINSEVVLVTLVKCRLLHVLLHYVLVLRFLDLTGHDLFFLFLVSCMWIML